MKVTKSKRVIVVQLVVTGSRGTSTLIVVQLVVTRSGGTSTLLVALCYSHTLYFVRGDLLILIRRQKKKKKMVGL